MSVQRFTVDLDQTELACRILEAIVQTKRPKGASAHQALTNGPEPEQRQDMLRAAMAAIEYFAEQSSLSGALSSFGPVIH